MALQSDGKIVVGGYSETLFGDSTSFVVARYTSSGNIDSTFNGSGFQSTYLGSGFNFGMSVAVTNDGRIVVGGTNGNYAIVMYNYDGSLDPTFGTGGIQITPVGTFTSSIQSLILKDNTLYAVGYGQFPGTLGVVAGYILLPGRPLQ